MIKRGLLLLFVFYTSSLLGCDSEIKPGDSNVHSEYDDSKPVGGGCDGCELMYIGMPESINAVDTSEGWNEKGQKLLLTGIVYKLDGKTPAPDVIIYYWQTDNNGYYSPRDGMDNRARRHGHIRGWVKTGPDGRYSIYTIRPAAYPGDDIPAHIHTSIKEPDVKNEYYIDEFVFDDDPLLTGAKRRALQNRGGSGVLRVLISGDMQVAEHNIILGLNIPNYPIASSTNQNVGLSIGEEQPSFIPYHAWGPDKGSRACPVCKYGRHQGIIYFTGNNPDTSEIKKWLRFFEDESVKRGDSLKVYFVYGNGTNFSHEQSRTFLESLGKELGITKTALTYVPSLSDKETEANLNMLPENLDNAIVIYRQRKITDKYISLPAESSSYHSITTSLESAKSLFFDLKAPH